MHSSHTLHSKTTGFTLLEMLIVLGVVAIITAIAFSSFSQFNETQVLEGAASKTASVLRDARSRTLASTGGQQYGVHFATSTLTLFAGTSYASGAASNEIYALPSKVAVDAVSLSGGGRSVVFKRLSGQTDTHGTVVLTLASHATGTREIVINESGIADVQ